MSTHTRQAEVTKDVLGGSLALPLTVRYMMHTQMRVYLCVCACCLCVWCSICAKGKAVFNKQFAVDRLKRGCHMSVCLCVMLGFIQS